MAKTKQELQQLKSECEDMSKKLNELSEDELKEVTGGTIWDIAVKLKEKFFSSNNNDSKVGVNPDEHNIML